LEGKYSSKVAGTRPVTTTYSVPKFFAGLAIPALIAWKLMVSMATKSDKLRQAIKMGQYIKKVEELEKDKKAREKKD